MHSLTVSFSSSVQYFVGFFLLSTERGLYSFLILIMEFIDNYYTKIKVKRYASSDVFLSISKKNNMFL